MKQVHAVNNSAEAHIIGHYLEHSGLTVHIHGENLAGAVGGIAADNFIKILVPDDQYEQAIKLMAEWEASTPTQTHEATMQGTINHSEKNNHGNFWVYLLMGIVVGAVGHEVVGQMFEPTQESSQASLSETEDQNKDGIADVMYIYADSQSAHIKEMRTDNNFDGTYDSFNQYNTKGIITSSKTDYNFDGEIDAITQYDRNGITKLIKSDRNSDGNYDEFAQYDNKGIITSKKADYNFDGQTDSITEYDRNGTATLEKYDNNFDGNYDTFNKYDKTGNLVSAEHDDNFDGKVETKSTLKNQLFKEVTVDTDLDGNINIKMLYEHGVLKTEHIYHPKTQKIVKTQHYDTHSLKSAEYDSDLDGTLDTRYIYDKYEEIKSTEPIS